MDEQTYQATMRAVTRDLTERVGGLVDWVATVPNRNEVRVELLALARYAFTLAAAHPEESAERLRRLQAKLQQPNQSCRSITAR